MSAVPMTGAAQTDEAATAAVETSAVEEAAEESAAQATGKTNKDIGSYKSYLAKNSHENDAKANVEEIKLVNVAIDNTNSFVMPFTVEKNGMYELSFDYSYIVSGNKNTTYSIMIDGEIPYAEVSSMTLSRMWKNETEIKTDEASGDDISPKQVEAEGYVREHFSVYDKEGYYASPLTFYLKKGEHTLTLALSTNEAKIENVTFTYAKALPTYEEFLAEKKSAGAKVYDGENLVVQGESAMYKSEMYLIPQNDITNPLTIPYDPARIKLNTFGGANWKLNGENVTWVIDNVPADGLYKMSIRYRQNMYDGVSAHRRLYVNNEIQFAEANQLEFAYDNVWKTFTLKNENKDDLYVYLYKGTNTVSLEVVLGSSSKIAEELQECVLEMNTIYRQIIMITGSSPDDYRDYNIDKQIPTIVGDLTAARDRLNGIAEEVALQYGKDSSLIAKINNITRQLDIMIKKPAQISKSDRLGSFKSNISTIGSWISMFREQPLEIDRIEFYGDNGKAPRASANIFESFKHSFDRFVASFTQDYSSMGSSTEGTDVSVKVWIQSGRDQANILKQLITSDFTPNSSITVTDKDGNEKTGKIGIELELVTGAIIEATLAGKGPDVALTRGVTDPVNFAMRNALYDLSTFEDYEEQTKNFAEGAMIPFEYKDGVYALPETMSYQMMFVRTDITEELGLGVDKAGNSVPSYWANLTWSEILTEIYPIVSRNNMEIGIGNMNQISAMNASNIFTNVLYQKGGRIYDEDGTKTALTSKEGYESFKFSIELYADYLFPQEYDAMSRFRTGEMPILLADYTMYNVFSITIPELDGLWEMYPIPGEPVLDENGNVVFEDDGVTPKVNNLQAATTTACVMFGDANDTDPEAQLKAKAGWEFLKWWVSTDTQAEFGTRVEAVLGSGGRYATANRNAIPELPWNDKQLEALNAQMNELVFVEQLPGSYFTSRAINSAFMTSVLNAKNPNEQLLYWSQQIDLELARKLEEFAD